MNKDQILKIGKVTIVIVRKFTGKDSLERKLQRLILEKD